MEFLGHLSATQSDFPRVYGVTVREYLHWLTMNPPREDLATTQNSLQRTVDHARLYCPYHTNVAFQAPDLHFEDMTSSVRFQAHSINLSRFLGRGAFGSVFAGTLTVPYNNGSTVGQGVSTIR
ncbi:hypothetical protein FBUS_02499 [Fasciolopsis buskii]|uniref:Uncharacterized protein n=1 Tax=Fasciolopsis buskii TaxID=27845 RepID=A0A8E0RYS7_9TREM|nr:hypothetical protein FBUS_02499 [Fasciolopsis buski]